MSYIQDGINKDVEPMGPSGFGRFDELLLRTPACGCGFLLMELPEVPLEKGSVVNTTQVHDDTYQVIRIVALSFLSTT